VHIDDLRLSDRPGSVRRLLAANQLHDRVPGRRDLVDVAEYLTYLTEHAIGSTTRALKLSAIWSRAVVRRLRCGASGKAPPRSGPHPAGLTPVEAISLLTPAGRPLQFTRTCSAIDRCQGAPGTGRRRAENERSQRLTSQQPRAFNERRLTRRGAVRAGGLGAAALVGGATLTPASAQEAANR
jgi:hypothetical protein